MEVSKLNLEQNSFVLIVVLVLIVSNFAGDLKEDVEKIIGGREVKQYHLYPYAVAIFITHRNSYTCMGGVLHWSYVITSCHCLTVNFDTKPRPLNYRNTKEARFVVSGTNYISAIYPTKKTRRMSWWGLLPLTPISEKVQGNLGEQRRDMREVFIHVRCRTKMGYPMDDIGVMRLNTPFERRPLLSVALLPVFSHVFWRAMSYFQNVFRSNGTCHSIGWGVVTYTEPDDIVPDVRTKLTCYIKEAPMKVVTTATCVNRMCYEHFEDQCTERFRRRMMEEEFILFNTEICAYAKYCPLDQGPCLGIKHFCRFIRDPNSLKPFVHNFQPSDSGHPFMCRTGDPKSNEYRDYLAGVSTTTMYCGLFGGEPNLFGNVPKY